MAKTVAITELLPPTNLAPTLVAGGSLVAGTTYYYRMVAVEMSGSNGRVDSCYAISAPSAEVFAVCDAVNKSVKLDWTATAKIKAGGYLGYLIFRTTVSGDYGTATNKLIFSTAVPPEGFPTLPATSAITFTDDGTRTMGAAVLPPLGSPLVEVDGGTTSDRIDEEFIYQAFVTAGKTNFATKIDTIAGALGIHYSFRGFFRFSYLVQAFWKINPSRVVYIEGQIRVNTSSDFIMGTNSANGAILGVAGSLGDCQSYIGGKYYIYNSKLIDLNTSMGIPSGGGGGGYFKPSASWGGVRGDGGVQSLIKNSSIYTYGSNNNFSGDVYIDGCIVETSPRLEVSTKVPSFVGVAFSGGSNSLYTYAAYYIPVIRCSMLQTTRDFHFHGVNTYYRVIDLIDYTSINNPVKAASSTNPQFGIYLRRWSLNATITDYDNVPLQNVAISVKDKNGNSSVFVNSGATFSAIGTAVTTSIVVSNGALFAVGDVIKCNAEIMLVTNVISNTLTVTRGYQGTLANPWMGSDYTVWKQREEVLTDANGQIPEQYLLAETYQGKATGIDPYKYDTVVYTPHTISVTKAGYESYSDVKTVGAPIVLNLKMKTALRIRKGIEGEHYYALRPEEGSSAKILKV